MPTTVTHGSDVFVVYGSERIGGERMTRIYAWPLGASTIEQAQKAVLEHAASDWLSGDKPESVVTRSLFLIDVCNCGTITGAHKSSCPQCPPKYR